MRGDDACEVLWDREVEERWLVVSRQQNPIILREETRTEEGPLQWLRVKSPLLAIPVFLWTLNAIPLTEQFPKLPRTPRKPLNLSTARITAIHLLAGQRDGEKEGRILQLLVLQWDPT